MRKKSLLETNPYLKDLELRAALFKLSVDSSTAVEGILTQYPKLSRKMIKKMRDIAAAQEAQKKADNCSCSLF